MSILVNSDTRVICQGITGSYGGRHAKACLEYGTKLVAGVTPGKGGQVFDPDGFKIPVYNTVAEAKEKHNANATMIFVPPRFAAGAIMEAADAGIEVIVAITEGIPANDLSLIHI